MSKRPSSPSQSPPKHPRQDQFSSLPDPSKQEQGTSSLASHRRLPNDALARFINDLRSYFTPRLYATRTTEVLGQLYTDFEDAYHGHQSNFVSEDVFMENLGTRTNFDFCNLLKRAIREDATEDDCQAVVTHDAFWTILPPEPIVPRDVMMSPEERAVIESWSVEFIGRAPLEGLKNHIAQELSVSSRYRYCCIVQSSGTGKSRLLDEFSKAHFMIPIVLRAFRSNGFPPTDGQVRNFLKIEAWTRGGPTLAYSQAYHFLLALFEKTKETVAQWTDLSHRAERVLRFREFMSRGQNMESTGEDRENFYKDVVARAESHMKKQLNMRDENLIHAFERLRYAVNGETRPLETEVDIYLMFDGAHMLAEPFHNFDLRCPLSELQRALQILSTRALWSFYVSTSAIILHASQRPRSQDPSCRLPRPYIHMGFDQLMEGQKISKNSTLEDVTSFECIAHMGRPMWGTLYDYGYRALLGFAMEKLLCATGVNDLTDAQIYAVLSQRLALDIDTPKYVSTPRNDVITREKLGEIMHDQIKFHMRICVSAEDGLDSLRGIALSEPILSRAACAIMEGGRLKFNLPVALGRAMSGFCLNRYARTRLFVAALFIWARDQDEPVKKRTDYLTVKELFEILFCDPIFESILEDMPSLCPQKVTPQPFREVFGEANMHFNHFIKPYEQEVLTRRCLVRFMARGAAGFSANEEAGFNAVYPYLYGGIDLDVKKIGFIMVQFKNDSNDEEYDIDLQGNGSVQMWLA